MPLRPASAFLSSHRNHSLLTGGAAGSAGVLARRAGRATLVTASGTVPVEPGSVVFVPAGETHKFTDITEDLALVVISRRVMDHVRDAWKVTRSRGRRFKSGRPDAAHEHAGHGKRRW
jgi:hypothetical protein